ncbi:alpha-amylase [Solitalea sp. MAHUQ-68]|uniref:Alpha-amylase n=1 Tax=Solitalea agri TaxID=2953739 RepID=A0A9X2F323_9SPHI|nr:alpha-amylase [Solitalea agri]MCO4293807.1 alpha-amylase [Solitalea agri]
MKKNLMQNCITVSPARERLVMQLFKQTSLILGLFITLNFSLSSCKKDLELITKADLNQEISKPNSSKSTEAVPGQTGVMMQGFYWDVPMTTPAGSWWQNLQAKATELSQAGITAIWIPPANKGGSVYDVGYGVYDHYDLGEFNQKGTVATRYGTLGQLQSAISALHQNNIGVYEDIVMNHMMNADYSETVNGKTVWTGFNFPGRNNTYSSFTWNHNNFNAVDQSGWIMFNNWDFQPYNNGDFYDGLMGCEIRFSDAAQRNEMVTWGNWITQKLSLDGYRLDAVKHIHTPFLNQWLDNVKGARFAVGECWSNDIQNLQNYVSSTGGRMSLFDVPLHYTFKAMSDGNGSWDMRGLQFAGFTEANGDLSVPFVDNHDTDAPSGALRSPIVNLKMLAYSYILLRHKGYPCVYYRDYYEYGLGNQIKKLIEIRKNNAYGAANEYTSVNDADVYAYSRAGDATHKGLLMLLNDGSNAASKGITTPFPNATLTDKTGNTAGTVTTNASGYGVFPVNGRSYAVWVPNSTGGGSNTAVTFNITFSNTVSGQDLYIVGSIPALGSWNTANAVKMTCPAWPAWTQTISLPTGQYIEYKYIRKDASGNVLWEPGSNKNITPAGSSQTRNDTW